ncbi:thioredoxin fold domain-containing protein [candidate division KSB1 bacterium]|nr:thioredoxin fold domain-containing protein [candidate division KSB1 bacterium]
MRKLFIILLLVTSFTISNCSGQNEDDLRAENKNEKKVELTSQAKSTPKAEWIGFDEGLAKAAKEKKHMIVDFYTDWCHWCKVMDEKTFSETSINSKLVDRFITVRIDAENSSKTATYKGNTYTNIQLTQAFGVRGFPSLAFMDKDGEIITIVPGYVPPETFIYILDYVDQECYKKQMPFDEFMKKQGKCDDSESAKS